VLFVEFRFAVFFAVAFLVHWALRRNALRKAWLLACSYAFYAGWDWRFVGLIALSTLIDYLAGRCIYASRTQAARRRWVTISLVANLGILGFFKYFGFFVDSATHFLLWLGLPTSQSSLEIILPLGISFYTFQSLSYSIDVYRGRFEPTRNLLDFALYVGFFPQLVAGPIVRAASFLPQLRVVRRFEDVDVRAALVLFLIGFFKKTCVADNVAPFVDRVFENPSAFDFAAHWMAVLAYAAQVYGDFSGYSDMAISCAALLGFKLSPNFRFPYLASSIADFWRRWHISLSTWLRDYLFFSLGGNRGTRARVGWNLMITMVLGGLWHGAGWNFVFWGFLHGIALAVHRVWQHRTKAWRPWPPILAWLGPLATFAFVAFSFVFFRASDVETGMAMARTLLFGGSTGELGPPPVLSAFVALLGAAHLTAAKFQGERPWDRLPSLGFAALLGVASALVLMLSPRESTPFIYFQF